MPALSDHMEAIRNKGIKCLGLYCLLNVEAAKYYLHIFLKVIKNDRETLKLTAVKIVFDFIMAFGLAAFADIEDVEEMGVISIVLFLSQI
jgi:condensin complex subunit 3